MLGVDDSWFAYPGDAMEGEEKEEKEEKEGNRQTRLAIAVLCECGENTVAPDGDDDDSNDVSSVDDMAKGGCLVAAVSRLETMLGRLEIGK